MAENVDKMIKATTDKLLNQLDEQSKKLSTIKKMSALLKELDEDTTELDAVLDLSEKVTQDIQKRFKPKSE